MPRFSETVMDHFQSPRNWGVLESADLVGIAGVPGRGRHLILQINVTDGRVSQVAFRCHGCGATIAAGSMLTELISGKSIDECRDINSDQVLDALDGLPADKQHGAEFAIAALRSALDDYDQGALAGNTNNGSTTHEDPA